MKNSVKGAVSYNCDSQNGGGRWKIKPRNRRDNTQNANNIGSNYGEMFESMEPGIVSMIVVTTMP